MVVGYSYFTVSHLLRKLATITLRATVGLCGVLALVVGTDLCHYVWALVHSLMSLNTLRVAHVSFMDLFALLPLGPLSHFKCYAFCYYFVGSVFFAQVTLAGAQQDLNAVGVLRTDCLD